MNRGKGRGGRGNKGKGRGGRGNKGKARGRNQDSTSNRDNTSRTDLSHYTYQVGSAKQASDFITVNEYLVRYIKRSFELGRDIMTSKQKRKRR